MKLVISVKKIKGRCPVYKVGDKMVIDGPGFDLKNTDKICIHALPSILHYAVALREGADPRKLGLSFNKDKAYVQCPDPGKPYTDGGTVVFEIKRNE
ncbi:MAG: TIGR04076 family protein [Euryarchaeota archaeon CG01_land_8_20_14_3_00_38_12]|nr:MAG: TIGR04076 family protein [Euryarchaeota archaeon CG01_land_8_20_14_3_00_38_12]